MPDGARHWAGLDDEARLAAVRELGLPAFRADQLSRHFFERHEADPLTWTDLPADRRVAVAGLFPVLLSEVRAVAADRGATTKTAYRLADGALVETVLMRYTRGDARTTLCVSSQAGCGMGCPFCATGQGGLKRNLSAAEIVEQVRLALVAGRVSNVVFMGMGEPLANYAAVLAAIRTICRPAPGGFGLSARGITVSTAGIVPRIHDLALAGLPVTLAVSLHAPDDELRDRLVPINTRWPVGELLDAARAYFTATGRRVSIEYALMRDVNDQVERAERLARELRTRGRGWVHVNLIPLNRTPGSEWTASRPGDAVRFQERLAAAAIPVTMRNSRGADIDGACGQLASRSTDTAVG